MFYVYVLQSLRDGKYYIGQTRSLRARIVRHNKGYVTSTKRRRPLKLIYFEEFASRNDAYKRERGIKGMKGGIQFKSLLERSSNGHREAGSRSAG